MVKFTGERLAMLEDTPALRSLDPGVSLGFPYYFDLHILLTTSQDSDQQDHSD